MRQPKRRPSRTDQTPSQRRFNRLIQQTVRQAMQDPEYQNYLQTQYGWEWQQMGKRARLKVSLPLPCPSPLLSLWARAIPTQVALHPDVTPPILRSILRHHPKLDVRQNPALPMLLLEDAKLLEPESEEEIPW
jgi:hypothetical protein